MINHSIIAKPGMYGLSYTELKEHYTRFVRMSDKKFMDALPEAMHFACITCWLKEVGPEASIGEAGIVHELAHLLHHGNGYGRRQKPGSRTTHIKAIRSQFAHTLKLA